MEKLEFAERVGQFYSRYGLPKMAGRILGYLLVCRPEHTSFDSLVQELKASKGSISQNLRLLLAQGMIEEELVTNSRKSHYKFSTEKMESVMMNKISSITRFQELIKVAIEMQDDSSLRFKKLSEVYEFYDFIEREIELIYQRWKDVSTRRTTLLLT